MPPPARTAPEILSIIEVDLVPAAIGDPIVRREVQLRRLRLALSACQASGNPVESAKSLLLAGEAAKDQDALEDILENEVDLSIRFARSSLMRLVLSDSDRASIHGGVLAHDAAQAARARDFIQAREQLHFHDVWIDRRRTLPDDQREKWKIDDGHLLARIEAIALTFGVHAAARDLFRWRPRVVRLRIGIRLVQLLINRGDASLIQEVLDKKLVPAHFEFLLLVPLLLAHAGGDLARLEVSLARVRRRLTPQWQKLVRHSDAEGWLHQILDLLITGCEIGYANGLSNSAIKHALSCVADFGTPIDTERRGLDAASLDLLLRGWIVWQQLSGDAASPEKAGDFLHPKPPAPPPDPKRKGRKAKARKQVNSNDRDDEDRKYFQAAYPIYESRSRILIKNASGSPVTDADLSLIAKFGDTYSLRREWETIQYRAVAAKSVLALMHLPFSIEKLLERATAIVNTKWTDPFATRVEPLWAFALLRPSSHQTLITEISKKCSLIKHERSPGSDKVAALIRLSRLALNFSPSDAKALFEDAVAKAQEIDREAIDQIHFMSVLARRCDNWPKSDRKDEAAKLFRFVTDVAIRLSDNDGFPWKAAIQALARLSPPTCLAGCSRWADEGLRPIQYSLPAVIEELVATGDMTGSAAAALVMLLSRADSDLIDSILSSYNGGNPTLSNVFDQLVRNCELNVPPGDLEGTATIILKHAKRLGLDHHADRLQVLLSFLASNETAPAPDSNAPPGNAETPLPDLSDGPYLTAQAVEDGIKAIRSQVNYFYLRSALNHMRDKIISPGDFVPFLNAISDADFERHSDTDRAYAILDALEAWGDTPALRQWRQTSLPRVIVNRFSGLTLWLRRGSNSLRPLLEATGLNKSDVGRLLIEGVQNTGLSMSSQSLFGVTEQLADTLAPDEAHEIHRWYADRLNGRVPPDLPSMDVSDIPDNFDDAFGRFMYALLSDVDTRIRWKAAHTLRAVARFGMNNLLNATFANLERKQDFSFRDPTAPFLLDVRETLVSHSHLAGFCRQP